MRSLISDKISSSNPGGSMGQNWPQVHFPCFFRLAKYMNRYSILSSSFVNRRPSTPFQNLLWLWTCSRKITCSMLPATLPSVVNCLLYSPNTGYRAACCKTLYTCNDNVCNLAKGGFVFSVSLLPFSAAESTTLAGNKLS